MNDIYKDSHERIKSLENKAFGLMTYISAIIAIVVFLLGKDLPTYLKILSCLSMFVLLLALILSFKCLGIKTQKTLFIDALFKWDESIENSNTEGSIPISVNKESIICSLIECTVYNHTVADNTADILRASRILLNFGIILSIVSFYVYIFSYKENKPVIKKIEVVNSNYIDSLTHKRNEELIKSFSEILELKKTIDNK